jgi:hypothetical protein
VQLLWRVAVQPVKNVCKAIFCRKGAKGKRDQKKNRMTLLPRTLQVQDWTLTTDDPPLGSLHKEGASVHMLHGSRQWDISREEDPRIDATHHQQCAAVGGVSAR